MLDESAPPVVAVLVASDPGPWFEECLASLAAQDYSAFSVLVIDAGSADDLAARVAAVLPKAYLHRQPQNTGFGSAANGVRELVSGASHYLFCHDDILLDPDAVRRMVEEAYRSNAAIVGPKYVTWHDRGVLRQVGIDVDRFGAPSPRVEGDEIDQSQHDEAREVFATPGGATLVRSDLFAAVGGFDDQIELFGEDVDLCWRARLAGARVVVTPLARVGHLEALASGRRACANPEALQRRHELRTVLKVYGRLRRMSIVFQLLVLSLAEIAYALATKERRRAANVARAWSWNLAHRRDLRVARAEIQAIRAVTDKELVPLQLTGTARLGHFVSHRIFGDGPGEPFGQSRRRARASESGPSRAGRASPSQRPAQRGLPGWWEANRRLTLLLGLVALFLLFGSRDLLFQPLPLVGQLLPVPGPVQLWSEFFRGSTDVGLQATGPAPPGLALLGLASLVTFGHGGLVERGLLLLPLVVGPIGVARLVGRFSSRHATIVAALSYLLLALPWNDIARGSIEGLVAYAGMPWILGSLVLASGSPPFEDRLAGIRLAPSNTGDQSSSAIGGARLGGAPTRRGRVRLLAVDSLAYGVLLAICGALAPVLFCVSLATAGLLGIALGLTGRLGSAGRVISVAVAGSVVSFLLLFPWSLTLLQSGARWSILSGARSGFSPSLGQLFRFDVGPIGGGVLGWGLLAAAVFVLLVARGPRLEWGSRFFFVLLGSTSLALAGGRGWLGAGGGATGVILAPAAVALAFCIGLGVAGFEADLPRARFGWRQLSAVVAGGLLVLGLIPAVIAASGGRWDLPTTGFGQVLGWTEAVHPSPAYSVLWLGDPNALPLTSWQLAPGLGAGISSDGLPGIERLWPPANPGGATALFTALRSAENGSSVALDAALAAYRVRYIVVPTTLAPVLPGVQSAPSAPPPASLVTTLRLQENLRELPSEAGILVFEAVGYPRPGRAAAGLTSSLGVETSSGPRGAVDSPRVSLVLGSTQLAGSTRSKGAALASRAGDTSGADPALGSARAPRATAAGRGPTGSSEWWQLGLAGALLAWIGVGGVLLFERRRRGLRPHESQSAATEGLVPDELDRQRPEPAESVVAQGGRAADAGLAVRSGGEVLPEAGGQSARQDARRWRPMRLRGVIGLGAVGIAIVVVAHAGPPSATLAVSPAVLSGGPVISSPEALSSSWYCPGPLPVGRGADHRSLLVVTNLSSSARVGSLVISRPGERAAISTITVAARAEEDIPLARTGPDGFAAAELTFDGGGVGVEQVSSTAFATASSPCATEPGSSGYLATGSTAVNSVLRLSLYDPLSTAAVVDVSFATPTGQLAPAAFQGVVVEPEQAVVLDVGAYVEDSSEVATSARALSGEIVLGEFQQRPLASLHGSGLVLATARPARISAFEVPADAGAVADTLELYNPTPSPARATVTVVTGPGPAAATRAASDRGEDTTLSVRVPGDTLRSLPVLGARGGVGSPATRPGTASLVRVVSSGSGLVTGLVGVLSLPSPQPGARRVVGQRDATRSGVVLVGLSELSGRTLLSTGALVGTASLSPARSGPDTVAGWLVVGNVSSGPETVVITTLGPGAPQRMVARLPRLSGRAASIVVEGPVVLARHGSLSLALGSTPGSARAAALTVASSGPVVATVVARGGVSSSRDLQPASLAEGLPER